jgi:hypothetical protein
MPKKTERHLTHLRATAPGGVEDISQEAWEEFQALRSAQERQFQPTRPNSIPGSLSQRDARTRAAAKPAVSLDQVMVMARRNNRACPLPEHWTKLDAVLAQVAPAGAKPPAAIDGAAWQAVPSMQKRLRLKEQLEWSEKHGCLAAASELLAALPEDSWLHF